MGGYHAPNIRGWRAAMASGVGLILNGCLLGTRGPDWFVGQAIRTAIGPYCSPVLNLASKFKAFDQPEIHAGSRLFAVVVARPHLSQARPRSFAPVDKGVDAPTREKKSTDRKSVV